MTNASCSRSAEQLTRYLSEGGELPPELIEHVRHCSDCGETLRRAQLLGELLERTRDEQPRLAAPAALSQVMTHEVIAAVRRRRRLRAGLAIAIAVIGVASWYLTATAMHVHHRYALWSMLMILFTGPLVLVAMTAGIDAGGAGRLVKRIRGRQLSGICQGLSEATQVSVWIWRMAFVGFIFFKGAGVILYLLLDVALPVHPDDGADLLRFRVARWWKRRRVAAAGHG
jgi:phage shock protein PspC (stress-responsive transcriptional regulator)